MVEKTAVYTVIIQYRTFLMTGVDAVSVHFRKPLNKTTHLLPSLFSFAALQSSSPFSSKSSDLEGNSGRFFSTGDDRVGGSASFLIDVSCFSIQ